ncbi:ribonuclease P protein subunit [Candidatus Woesearchaeota archaeon]|nr:ribonuclease P protein subunit [Candidatus Woesearchaeota archaeon]
MSQTERKELIGQCVTVVEAQNANLIGIKGKVIDETQNMLVLDNHKIIIKSQVAIKVGDEVIKGKDIKRRPEDRLKR